MNPHPKWTWYFEKQHLDLITINSDELIHIDSVIGPSLLSMHFAELLSLYVFVVIHVANKHNFPTCINQDKCQVHCALL